MLRGMWGEGGTERTKEVYFSQFPGMYFSGDGARKDEDLAALDEIIPALKSQQPEFAPGNVRFYEGDSCGRPQGYQGTG